MTRSKDVEREPPEPYDLARVFRCPECSTLYLTPTEAAARLGVDRRTVQRWLRAGKIPRAVLLEAPGRSMWLIPEDDLEAFRRSGIAPRSMHQ